MTIKECYRILGLAATANLDDVKHAYRRRAFELHPDLNPHLVDAGRQFQLLNEAYVVLMKVLADQESKAGTAETGGKKDREQPPGAERGSDQGATHETHEPGPKAPGHEDAHADAGRHAGHDWGQAGHAAAGTSAGAGGESPPGEAGTTEAKPGEAKTDETETADRRRRMADSAYARQEDVLRDILGDPFARRVFEDIYSEVNKQQAAQGGKDKAEATLPAPPPKTRKLNLEWGDSILNLDFTGGVGGMMRHWLRHQIDDKLTVRLPRARLFPGARVRLQIRQGFTNELRVIEITLPQDFRTGKAIRLKGLGRKVGKWTGDLYVTIEDQQQQSP